jgi:hypothetical protein
MWFLRRRDGAEAWWAAVADYRSSVPGLIRELLNGPSVVCDGYEARQAMAWARAHPAWREDDPALEVIDTLEGA